MAEYLIVTGEEDFARFVVEQGIAPADAPVVYRAREEDVRGRHVVCHQLPLELAEKAESVTTLELDAPPWVRRRNMRFDQWCEYAIRANTFRTVLHESHPLKGED